MNELLELLESLNRKERFFLVGSALDNQSFSLGQRFRSELESCIGVPVPGDAWVAMDYHLDWIAAAVHLANSGDIHALRFENPNQQIVHGNQEDVDLIVGFEQGSETILVLIEAKATTAWSKSQMDSKVRRLDEIFGSDKRTSQNIRPILVLTSPNPPTEKLGTAGWADWMTKEGAPRWMLLPIKARRQLIRCNENGNPDANGQHAKIVQRN